MAHAATAAALERSKSNQEIEKAAATGDLDAQATLGIRYENAEGVARDYDTALRLYCDAARRGHAESAYRLGWMYAYGRGTERNDDQAAAWFRLAGTRGHFYAAAALRLVRGNDINLLPLCPGESEPQASGENPPQGKAGRLAVPDDIRHMVLRLAPRYRLDPGLVIAVIKIESDFRGGAVSRAKAQGLMQIIPATGKRFGLLDAFDPEQNITAGMTYLRWLLDRFGGDVELALAAYNSGENAVDRYKGVPPYPETIEYLRRFRELGFIGVKPTRSSFID